MVKSSTIEEDNEKELTARIFSKIFYKTNFVIKGKSTDVRHGSFKSPDSKGFVVYYSVKS
jgi:hypothetical protein